MRPREYTTLEMVMCGQFLKHTHLKHEERRILRVSMSLPRDNDCSTTVLRPAGFPEAAALDSNHIVCTSTRNGRTVLSVLTLSDGARAELATPYAAAAHLRSASPGKVLFVGRTDVTPTAIVEMAVDPRDVRGTLSFAEIGTARCHRRTEIPHSAGCISTPATVELAHPNGGARLVATCYPPTHAGLAGGVPGELPPVVVRVFGNGERPPPGLDWAVQVYTTRGFAWYVPDSPTA